ncbi:MAG TPA: translesion DNA synthesis-associated protein ImuA [Accumulibacter sp.]|uniref:translesion DNA synthesis-associated protein ImuA n=1 Tax=Accumulibacter sp. TaxID=2053492 RepID=UPI000EE988A1|nr:translesion DNA synthesis-associated protein ImuA [Accumulibacter sp.]HCZ13165.1 translesion DNA synthesis-associated protein ImuA [Accumulibacter sp.]HRF72661.1 translesion DNA synthesis-associated protein ImuA [Accumulibacter sp.]
MASTISSSLTLSQALDRADVWRGATLARAPLPGVPTGFAELDRELPGGGWPRGGLTEILPLRRGIGELSLLLPALARLSSDELAWLVCVAPPHPLHAPALQKCGVDLSRLLVASAPGRDAAWACERSLVADGVGAVVAWLPEVQATSLRRLQLAAESSRTLLFVFRPAACVSQSSPAPLRLALDGDGEQLRVRLLKRRGGAQPAPLPIAIQRPVRLSHALACPLPAAPAARGLSQPAIA